jgi:hypothetical protein
MSDDPVLPALADLSTRFGRLEAGQDKLHIELMARMDRLENSLADIRNDIAVNFGTADAVKRANDNTREEMRSLHDIVAALVRKIQTLETKVREITKEP